MEKQITQLARRSLAFAFALCGFVHAALGFQTSVQMAHVVDEKKGIEMTCDLPLGAVPPTGYCPVHLRIQNKTGSAHTWRFNFQFSGMGTRGMGMRYTTDVSVGAGQTREWDILIPRPGLESQESMYNSLQGTVEGYAVNSSGRFYLPTHYSGGYGRTVFTVMSESLATAVWSKVDATVKTAAAPDPDPALRRLTSTRFSRGHARSGSRDLAGSQVDLSELPPDWRAYSGFGALWLSKVDWENLSSDRRRAIRQWVTAGGHLFVASTEDTIDRLALLPSNLEVDKEQPLGLGWIKAIKLVGGELDPAATAREILGLDSAPLPACQDDYQETWELSDYVGWPRLNVPLVIGFVALFAIVVGPLNLRWFAPQKRRARLFLTVPLFSVAASVVLFGVIAIGDGFGGIGGRNVLLYMPAAENQVTVLQEQIARSRLLFSRAFNVPETVQVSFAPQDRESDRGVSFERTGDVLSGDWFRSRTVQTHLLRAHVPSRAEVTLQPGSAPDGPPVLLSSAASPLRNFYYVDAAGRYWKADKVDTGRPVKLEPSSREALDMWISTVSGELSVNFASVLQDVAHRPGHFYAVADAMPEGPIATLSSLRWHKQNVVCFGTCTGAESK